jgi:cytochrome c5
MNKIRLTVVAGIVMTLGTVAEAGGTGEQIYNSSCTACHATGAAGAPKLGDREAWAPRIATGNDSLLASLMNGKNAMPPKGACASCSDADLKAALDYLVSQSK